MTTSKKKEDNKGAEVKTKKEPKDDYDVLLAKGYELTIMTKTKAIQILPGGKRIVHRMGKS